MWELSTSADLLSHGRQNHSSAPYSSADMENYFSKDPLMFLSSRDTEVPLFNSVLASDGSNVALKRRIRWKRKLTRNVTYKHLMSTWGLRRYFRINTSMELIQLNKVHVSHITKISWTTVEKCNADCSAKRSLSSKNVSNVSCLWCWSGQQHPAGCVHQQPSRNVTSYLWRSIFQWTCRLKSVWNWSWSVWILHIMAERRAYYCWKKRYVAICSFII